MTFNPSEYHEKKFFETHLIKTQKDGSLVVKEKKGCIKWLGKAWRWMFHPNTRMDRVRVRLVKTAQEQVKQASDNRLERIEKLKNVLLNLRGFQNKVIDKHNSTRWSRIFFWTRVKNVPADIKQSIKSTCETLIKEECDDLAIINDEDTFDKARKLIFCADKLYADQPEKPESLKTLKEKVLKHIQNFINDKETDVNDLKHGIDDNSWNDELKSKNENLSVLNFKTTATWVKKSLPQQEGLSDRLDQIDQKLKKIHDEISAKTLSVESLIEVYKRVSKIPHTSRELAYVSAPIKGKDKIQDLITITYVDQKQRDELERLKKQRVDLLTIYNEMKRVRDEVTVVHKKVINCCQRDNFDQLKQEVENLRDKYKEPEKLLVGIDDDLFERLSGKANFKRIVQCVISTTETGFRKVGEKAGEILIKKIDEYLKKLENPDVETLATTLEETKITKEAYDACLKKVPYNSYSDSVRNRLVNAYDVYIERRKHLEQVIEFLKCCKGAIEAVAKNKLKSEYVSEEIQSKFDQIQEYYHIPTRFSERIDEIFEASKGKISAVKEIKDFNQTIKSINDAFGNEQQLIEVLSKENIVISEVFLSIGVKYVRMVGKSRKYELSDQAIVNELDERFEQFNTLYSESIKKFEKHETIVNNTFDVMQSISLDCSDYNEINNNLTHFPTKQEIKKVCTLAIVDKKRRETVESRYDAVKAVGYLKPLKKEYEKISEFEGAVYENPVNQLQKVERYFKDVKAKCALLEKNIGKESILYIEFKNHENKLNALMIQINLIKNLQVVSKSITLSNWKKASMYCEAAKAAVENMQCRVNPSVTQLLGTLKDQVSKLLKEQESDFEKLDAEYKKVVSQLGGWINKAIEIATLQTLSFLIKNAKAPDQNKLIKPLLKNKLIGNEKACELQKLAKQPNSQLLDTLLEHKDLLRKYAKIWDGDVHPSEQKEMEQLRKIAALDGCPPKMKVQIVLLEEMYDCQFHPKSTDPIMFTEFTDPVRVSYEEKKKVKRNYSWSHKSYEVEVGTGKWHHHYYNRPTFLKISSSHGSKDPIDPIWIIPLSKCEKQDAPEILKLQNKYEDFVFQQATKTLTLSNYQYVKKLLDKFQPITYCKDLKKKIDQLAKNDLSNELRGFSNKLIDYRYIQYFDQVQQWPDKLYDVREINELYKKISKSTNNIKENAQPLKELLENLDREFFKKLNAYNDAIILCNKIFTSIDYFKGRKNIVTKLEAKETLLKQAQNSITALKKEIERLAKKPNLLMDIDEIKQKLETLKLDELKKEYDAIYEKLKNWYSNQLKNTTLETLKQNVNKANETNLGDLIKDMISNPLVGDAKVQELKKLTKKSDWWITLEKYLNEEPLNERDKIVLNNVRVDSNCPDKLKTVIKHLTCN